MFFNDLGRVRYVCATEEHTGMASDSKSPTLNVGNKEEGLAEAAHKAQESVVHFHAVPCSNCSQS